MKIEEIVITPHAIERFKERYEARLGVKLNDAELMNKLGDLISKAVPEEESPILKARRQTHGGTGTYFVNMPWRFVFSRKRLETCEIVPQEMFFVINSQILDGEEKNRFYIKIKLNRKKLTTKITRSFDKKTLHLQNLIEIDTIIRALRILGIEVNQLSEPNRLEIVVPQNINGYLIEQLARPENILISLGRTDSFPLGLQKAYCLGITKLDLERILKFIQINKS